MPVNLSIRPDRVVFILGNPIMRRFMTTSAFVSIGLMTCVVCMAQNEQSDAPDAKANSPTMWQQYKQMWRGEWETSLVMPVDAEEIGLKQGDKLTGTMIDKPILQGHGLQITRTFRNSEGDVVVTHRCLASWCPKVKKILLYELTSAGERTEAVIEIVDGEEHNSGTTIQPNGEQITGSVIVTKEGKNTRKLKVTEGPATGFEITWTRKKAE